MRDFRRSGCPPGIEIRTYRESRDDAAWLAGFNEAFADHWGAFMTMTRARWDHQRRSETFDPRLSLVAWRDGRIAGFCHGVVAAELNALRGQPSGMIRYVGVPPAWRRIGLGAAFAGAGLCALRERGVETVVLEVDAASPTGVQRLNGTHGFAIVGRQLLFRREITALTTASRTSPPPRFS